MKRKWTKVLSIFLMLAMLITLLPQLALPARAAESISGTCGDNITWFLNRDTGELTISGSGDMPDWSYSDVAPWYEYRNEITSVGIEDCVTAIGDYAFLRCENLISVTIPDSVTSIGSGAFFDCINLTSVTFPDHLMNIGQNAFNGCSSLTSVTIPEDVPLIYMHTFNNCGVLTSITFLNPEIRIESFSALNVSNVKIYGYAGSTALGYAEKYGYAFFPLDVMEAAEVTGTCGDDLTWSLDRDTGELSIYGCGDMWDLEPSEPLEMPWNAYTDEIKTLTVYSGVTSIGSYAFCNHTALTAFTLPGTLACIGEQSFYLCSALEEITLPYGLTEIGPGAFSDCSGLVYADPLIPDTVQTIGAYAFSNSNVTNVCIPASVTYIGERAFWCYDLLYIIVDNPDCEINSDPGTLCVENAIFGYPGSTAEEYAEANHCTFVGFANENSELDVACVSSTYDAVKWYLNCETGVLTITANNQDGWTDSPLYSEAAWRDHWQEITSVEIKDGVKNICYRAFYQCDNLSSVTIPESVTSIGEEAFRGCSSLTEITIPNPNSEIYANKYTLNYPQNVTVRGYIGSTAEDYATTYGYTFIPLDAPEENIVSGECGENLTWSLNRDTGVLTISGTGAMDDFVPRRGANVPAPWGAYSAELIEAVFEDGVTSIGDYAFAGCENLTSVTIPDSVARIGDNAFHNCSSLMDLTIPNPACDFWFSVGLPDLTKIHGYSGSTAEAYAGVHNLVFVPLEGAPAQSWYFNESKGLLVICSDEAMRNWSAYHRPPWNDYRNDICTIVIFPEMTTIYSDHAFSYCPNLTEFIVDENNANYCSIDGVLFNKAGTRLVFYPTARTDSYTIPDGVTSIGGSAFFKCAGLTEVSIPDGVTYVGGYAFSNCTSLTSLTIPDTMTSINSSTFSDCTSLTSVTIPDSVTSILDNAFSSCTSLTSVTIPDSVTSIGQFAFNSCTDLRSVTIPGGVTSIGKNAFGRCTNLTNVMIQEGLRGISEGMFSYCTSLTSVIIPDGVRYIDISAFTGCTNLTNVTIPDSVTSISNSAFSGCVSLTSMTIPKNVTYIGVSAFSGCTGLKNVTIPNSVTIIGNSAFNNCTSLTSVTIPDSVTTISYKTFYNCSSLTSVKLPVSITSIGNETFYNCTSLSSITIPDSVKSISYFAFYNCTSLTSITIPDSVTSIDMSAFCGCTGLAEITILNPACQIFDSSLTLGSAATTTVYGYAGSTAEAYAVKYGYNFVPLEEEYTSYTVHFDANGGSGEMADQEIDFDVSAALTRNAFTRTGHVFTGWNTAADGSGTAYTNGKTVKNLTSGREITLYAQWRANSYTVRYNANGGSGTMADQSAVYDAPITLRANTFTRTGYVFNGWNTKAGGTGTAYSDAQQTENLASNGTLILYAQWTPNHYAVEFIANGGSGTMPNQDIAYGASVALTKNAFTRTGYTFTSWNTMPDGSGTAYTNGKSVRNLATGGTVTLYAQWKPNTYTVKFSSNGGSGTMATQTLTYDRAEALNANAFTRTGFVFNGWNTKAGGTGTAYADSQEVSNLLTGGTILLYAQWSANTYEIAFDPNGGTGSMANQQMKYGTAATLTRNAFTRTGYTFSGWNSMPDGSGTAYANAASVKNLAFGGVVTMYAQWKPNNYTVKFHANSGSGTMAAQVLTYGSPEALSANTFTRTGYTFSGWNTASNGSGTSYADGQEVSSLAASGSVTLYAQWSANSYEIAFDPNGGTGAMANQQMKYNTAAILTKNAFTRTGYTFSVWNTMPDGSGTAYANAASVKNLATGGVVTLYAQWKPNNYTVKFYANGGSGTMSAQILTYDRVDALNANTFTRTGFVFNGWNTKTGGTGTFYSDGQDVYNLLTSGSLILYAQWSANPYEVAFEPNGGAGTMANQQMKYGTAAALTKNAFTRTGYTFTGWNTVPDGSGTAYANAASVKNLATGGVVTMYAQWRPNTYTVKFSANSGSGTMAAQTLTYDRAEALNANAFTRTGYVFNGWNTKVGGTGTAYTDSQEVSNLLTGGTILLYAQWSANPYEIAFDPNGGTGAMANQQMKYGTAATLRRNAFTRTGFTFSGWNSMPDGSGTAYANAASVKNLATGGVVTMYAQWNPQNP